MQLLEDCAKDHQFSVLSLQIFKAMVSLSTHFLCFTGCSRNCTDLFWE